MLFSATRRQVEATREYSGRDVYLTTSRTEPPKYVETVEWQKSSSELAGWQASFCPHRLYMFTYIYIYIGMPCLRPTEVLEGIMHTWMAAFVWCSGFDDYDPFGRVRFLHVTST